MVDLFSEGFGNAHRDFLSSMGIRTVWRDSIWKGDRAATTAGLVPLNLGIR